MTCTQQTEHPVDQLKDIVDRIDELEGSRKAVFKNPLMKVDPPFCSKQLRNLTREIQKLEALKSELMEKVIADRELRVGLRNLARVTEVKTEDGVKKNVVICSLPHYLEILQAIHIDPEILALDVETTGLSSASGDRVVSLNITKYRIKMGLDGTYKSEKIKEHDYKFNPERESSEVALGIHGFTREMTDRFPRFSLHAKEISKLIRGHSLLGQNTQFDIEFLNSELEICDEEPLDPEYVFDTKIYSQMLWPGQSSSLSDVVKRLGIGEQAETHTATDDVSLTVKLFVHQLNEFLIFEQ